MRDTSMRVDVGWNRKYIHFPVDLRRYMTLGACPLGHHGQSIIPVQAYGMAYERCYTLTLGSMPGHTVKPSQCWKFELR